MAVGRTPLTLEQTVAGKANAASQAFPHLFAPLKLRGLMLPNRVVMAPMSTNLGTRDGQVTDETLAFYRARAAGGTAMIIVEFCCVEPLTGRSEHRQLAINTPAHLEGHRKLVDTIHEAGSIACLQLQHGGQGARRDSIGDDLPLSPSDMFSRKDATRRTARAMTEAEVERIIVRFGEAAAAGIEAGYDAVELHGAHGYLLTSFISPLTNHRDDAWGGDETRRLEFPRRVIAAVRAAIGDRPLIYRLSADEFSPKGLNVEDMARIAPKLVAAGADALHVSLGLGWTGLENVIEPSSQPEGWRLPFTRRIKQAVDVPVITVGQIRWPAMAEKAIAAGDCDIIALGRPLLADPDWTIKAATGRVDEIRPCTSCNYCVALSMPADGRIGCAENPRAGHETEPLLDAPRRGAKAVVIGAGPGGMAAALMLDQAGYDTEIIEARVSLGGGLVASAAPPHKDKLAWYQVYLEHRLAASKVKVTTGTLADADLIVARGPDIIFVASGRSTPSALPIEGYDAPIVHDAYEMLMGDDGWLKAVPPGTVLVYGGGETGCEAAEYLTERGRDVLLVSRSSLKDLARTAEFIYRTVLLRRLKTNKHLRIVGDTTMVRIDGNDVVLRGVDGQESRVTVAGVLVAQGRVTDTGLISELETRGLNVRVIGDARTGGRIGDAVRDAYEAVAGLAAPSRAAPTLGQVAC